MGFKMGAKGKMVTSVKMTLDEWYKVEDNPIQRDTERHAMKAKHLKLFHPTHAVVHAAQLPSGKYIKLDGHTRALMWRRGDAPCPPFQLIVLVYPVKDRAGAEQLYKDFDSNLALETSRDKVSGAFKRHHFEPESGLLQTGAITYAMKTAYGLLKGGTVFSAQEGKNSKGSVANLAIQKADVYEMIDEFSYELHALDAFGVGQGEAQSGVISAFLISYRKYGHKITPFWTGYFGDKGSKIDGQMDAIQALRELTLARRGSYGGKAATDVCARALNAVEGWLIDKMYTSVPRPMDTTGYMIGTEKPSERLIKKADFDKVTASKSAAARA